MPYRLIYLAPGSYDIELDGEIVGSLICWPPSGRAGSRWIAQLLSEDGPRPTPFVAVEHAFPTFEGVLEWLGDPEVNRPRGMSRV